ncbi:MAG: NAD(P)H-hydrate epimerase, partial [Chloroflexi bacterium]|nr:NAD(P)H-hydrate epimerase [Chloroflexota bacterium]
MIIVTVEEMRELEQHATREGVSLDTLMENAGAAVTRVAWGLLPDPKNSRVVALVGPGNNGGDGLVAARLLQQGGARVTVYLCTLRREEDPKLSLAAAQGVRIVDATQDTDLGHLKELLGSAHLVLDAILGTGRIRSIGGAIKDVLQLLDAQRRQRPGLQIVAVDLPTGLDADTGEVDPVCPPADVTVTLGCPKLGLFRFPGAERVGRLVV